MTVTDSGERILRKGLLLVGMAIVMLVAALGMSGCKIDTPRPPGLPENLNATSVSATEVLLTWDAPLTGGKIDGYYVYRLISTLSGSSTHIGTTSSTSYIDTSVDAGTSYYYHVVAYNKGGEGQWVSFPLVTTPQQ